MHVGIFVMMCLIIPAIVAQVVEHWLQEREVAGSIPRRTIPKVLKMVPVATLLGTPHCKAYSFSFQPSQGNLRMLMNDKIMFDHYYCINSTNNWENEENTGALYFITSSHFPTRVCHALFGPLSSTHNLAHALRDAW